MLGTILGVPEDPSVAVSRISRLELIPAALVGVARRALSYL